ncbi:pre-mRNA-splicing factor 18 [Agrilus planipennis]|uniref:Pre-mRNA-splicing factor 18 n=1 Tax=Agrilus planipennis TaxID=224129 RepID=A0A7F5RDH6_AGRPL|nr:pre-mRNA-splicing factor 18 [Agrilus planipennis]
MDILKAEIAKKRKQLEETELVCSDKKYFKRADLVAKEHEEYQKKYGRLISEHCVSSVKSSEGFSGSLSNEDNLDRSGLPRHEVIARLRDRGEPILLFGETELDAFRRLRKCEILEPEMNKGFRNDFQEAMEKVDEAYLNELLANDEENKEGTTTKNKPQEPVMTYEEIQKMAKKMNRGYREHDMQVIVNFIELLIKQWHDQLQNRSPLERNCTRGKVTVATFEQTKVYLKPLLRKLKNHTLPDDILESLTEITLHLLNRNYLKASDAYLQMAIGNAPWPIGVTMVGIHARTGREKIFSKNVAHVMNDETQRKYIQAVKRLMTKCQEYYPTDPSRCVEYAAFGSPQTAKSGE